MAVDVLEGLLEEDDEVVQVSNYFYLLISSWAFLFMTTTLHSYSVVETYSHWLILTFKNISWICVQTWGRLKTHFLLHWRFLMAQRHSSFWNRCSQSRQSDQTEQSGVKGDDERCDQEPIGHSAWAPEILCADGELLYYKTVQCCTGREQSFCSTSWPQWMQGAGVIICGYSWECFWFCGTITFSKGSILSLTSWWGIQ